MQYVFGNNAINLNNVSETELLNFMLKDSNIDVSNICDGIKDMKRKEILAQHPYEIWQGTNGKWYTYLPDEEKGRVQKKRTTKTAIENVVIDYIEENENAPTIEQIFYEWIDLKLEREEIEKSTYSRYERSFQQYFANVKSDKLRIVDEFYIEKLVKDNIHELHLSNKAYSNMRTLLYGIFRYAKKRKLVPFKIHDVIDDIDFSKKEFTKIKHKDEEEVFMEDEKEKMVQYLEENQDLINLGLLLLFVTGLRIGELTVLGRKDIEDNIIHIHATETIYKTKDGSVKYDVKDSAKTDAGMRDVIVPAKYMWVINKIKRLSPFGEFVFMESGERIKSYQFRSRIYYLCKKLNITRKSPHKVRKTYGTILYDSGVPKSFIIEQMGHTDIRCVEQHYYYNRKSNNQKQKIVDSIAL